MSNMFDNEYIRQQFAEIVANNEDSIRISPQILWVDNSRDMFFTARSSISRLELEVVLAVSKYIGAVDVESTTDVESALELMQARVRAIGQILLGPEVSNQALLYGDVGYSKIVGRAFSLIGKP